jgi:hypothetical protein
MGGHHYRRAAPFVRHYEQYRSLRNEEVEFHLQDSRRFPSFVKVKVGQKSSASTLQGNTKAVLMESWMAVDEAIPRQAQSEGWKQGHKARIDSTVVETNIHLPRDAALLQDGIRILKRWLGEGQELSAWLGCIFVDHDRRLRRRVSPVDLAPLYPVSPLVSHRSRTLPCRSRYREGAFDYNERIGQWNSAITRLPLL